MLNYHINNNCIRCYDCGFFEIGVFMPNNYNLCGKCIFNRNSLKQSVNINYIINKKHNGPLSLEDNGSNILLVFEAPGIDEWSKSKPVCSKRMGSAAVKISNALASCGKKLTDYDIAEALYCFPGKSSKGTGQKIQKEVMLGSKFCQKYLEQEILSKNYKKIVCFGKIAQESVSRIFNNFFKLKIYRSFYNRTYFKYNVINTYHPMHQNFKNLTTFIQDNLL